jgi:16S rRNA (cytidine1402-2'-O)-methyltransferase
LQRLDAYTEISKIESWVDLLLEGKSMALVTDAGTPGISDPGALLVNRAQKRGVPVIPVPGPSAVVTLLSVSGFQETAFTFRGFFPRAAQEQEQEIRSAQENSMSRVFVWFESPHRIAESLERIEQLSPESQMIVGKELTKIHEKFFAGDSKSASEEVRQEIHREGPLGEWCFAIQFPKKSGLTSLEGVEMGENAPWKKALRCLLGAQIPPSDAAKRVSQEFGTPKKRVYEAALQISGKKTAEGG